MYRPRLTRSVIPNMFTALNMFCGFLSIISSADGNYNYAAWLIVVAALFDLLDGAMARLTNSSSELGVELDSLSDIISFGAAPAFLIYSSYLHIYEVPGIIISSALMIAGGFRLARFNVQLIGLNKSFFTGLPIPSSALTIALFSLSFYENSLYQQPVSDFIIPLILLLSILMVSKIKYDTFPDLSLAKIKKHPAPFIFFAVVTAAFIVFGIKAIFFAFVFVVLFGIFRHLFNLVFKTNKKEKIVQS